MNQTNMLYSAPTRGCGRRKAGGVYAECRLGSGGIPVDDCIVDPPLVVDESALALPKRGNVLRTLDPRNAGPGSVWHIFDRVGESFYPNVADKVEEVRRMGESRRLNAANIDFAKITPATRLVLAHPRAHLINFEAAYTAYAADSSWPPQGWICPRRRTVHTRDVIPAQMCAAAWWRDLEGGEALAESVATPASGARAVRRHMPWGSYDGWERLRGFVPVYATAIFMILPISGLAVIEGAHGEHTSALKLAQQAGVPVALVRE
jgi:hypothetical protein